MRIETIGDATLYLGDCIEIMPSIGLKPDVLITDPPYGVTYQSNQATNKAAPISNDGTRLALRLYKKLVPMIPQDIGVLWFTRWDVWPDVWEILGSRLAVNGLLVWDKGSPGMGNLNHWGCSYEMIASLGDIRTRGKRDNSVIRINGVPSVNRHHPTEKPVELMDYLIGKCTDASQTILDPFMGSGTTGVSCVTLGRKFVGIEIEERHFDRACERISAAYAQGRLFA
jgi:site-specific DNA-methyltransferase (adenine-specific)